MVIFTKVVVFCIIILVKKIIIVKKKLISIINISTCKKHRKHEVFQIHVSFHIYSGQNGK